MAETYSPSVAIGYGHRTTSNLHACKEEIFRKGALHLTWDEKKPAWPLFGLLRTVAATQFAPESRLFRRRARPKQQLDPQTTTLAAEIPSSQGLS